MSIGEAVAAAAALAWVLLRLWHILWTAETSVSVLRECRSFEALALAWVVLLGAVLMAARAEFGGGAVWERIVWWTLALLAGALAIFGPELREWSLRRTTRADQ